jgi:Pentapeptide repeats (8 copies)
MPLRTDQRLAPRRLRLGAGLQAMNATNWRRASVASPAAWLPSVLVGMSAAAALFGAWWVWGTQAAVKFLAAWWPWLLIGASGAVALSVFVWWLWWRLPKRQVDRLSAAITDAKARTDVEDNFRKTAGQLLGGAAVLIAATIAYVQFTQQQTSAHDLLISNQVSKGFELLGGQIEQRLGGIYALEGVMNTSERYHQPVLEALCAFVRDRTRPPLTDSLAGKVVEAIMKTFGTGPPQQEPQSPETDVQAALSVIGRRNEGAGTVDLARAHIPKAVLNKADLSAADLDFADLSGAFLSGANLRAAHLFNAYLRETVLSKTNLTGADLTGARHLTQGQLDQACGTNVKGLDKVDPPLTIKPCPAQ